MENERSWILTGTKWSGFLWMRRHRMQEGGPASVEFDFNWVLRREEDKSDVCGFFHTHPSWTSYPSQRDDQTMMAWVNCFGKSLICIIGGTDGTRGWEYDIDCDTPREIKIFKCPFGIFLAPIENYPEADYIRFIEEI